MVNPPKPPAKREDWIKLNTMTLSDAAKKYEKDYRFVRNMIDRGLPYYMLDGVKRVSIAQMEQYLYAKGFMKAGIDPRNILAFLPGMDKNWKAYAEFKTKAKRPKYSVLKNANLEKLGMDDLRSWQEALQAYLVEKGHLKPQ